MIENKLVTGLDIDLSTYGLGIIRQPTVKELINLPYEDAVLPFLLIEQYYNKAIEESDEEVYRLHFLLFLEEVSKVVIANERKKDKELYFYDPFIDNKKYYSLTNQFFDVLYILFSCKEEDIFLNNSDDTFQIVINDKAVIDKYNFDVLMEVIFKIFYIDKDSLLKTEEDKWVELTGSKKEKEMIERFKNKERKRKEKSKLHLGDYITYVVIQGGRTYEEVLNWTYFQLLHSYRAVNCKDRQDFEMRVLATGMSTLKAEDIYDWKKELKIEVDKKIY